MGRKGTDFIGVDLFAGAGGLSLGAEMAGIKVELAVELDKHAAATYAMNHPNTRLIVDDVRSVSSLEVASEGVVTILFGGPPCQGFSTSNQKTRGPENPLNWLFREFVRVTRLWQPDWVVFENVRGITETEGGLFLGALVSELASSGYTCSHFVLCASDYGVPQFRSRFFLLGSRHGARVQAPSKASLRSITVREAIGDLPDLPNGANIDYLPYPRAPISDYANSLRGSRSGCSGNLVTRNASYIIERYKHIPQGGNWQHIPSCLMGNYADRSRCHTGIYRRLQDDQPSVVLGNYRKNMLIHPWQNRGLSVREAARLQSFPDHYDFQGTIGFQQQQVANAVPPRLARAVFRTITGLEDWGK